MRIRLLDLTPAYFQARDLRDGGLSVAYPQLFQHYYRFWADLDDDIGLDEMQIRRRAHLVRSRLPGVQRAFSEHDFVGARDVVLFVGKGSSNGHAFWDDARRTFVVWLAVEAYATPLQIDVFATHELLHAWHYTFQPAFYFQDQATKNLIGRQIITEGLATWGTLEVLGCDDLTALWADYVSRDFAQRWYQQCQNREPEMAQYLLHAWHAHPADNAWFAMWDEHDVTQYRGGYYMGLQVMRFLHKHFGLDLHALLRFDAQALEALALTALEKMAQA